MTTAQTVRVKICGLNTVQSVEAALSAGADYLGFVFFPPSPRAVDVEFAKELVNIVSARAKCVALVVDKDLDFLDRLVAKVPIDVLQLHGSERPEDVALLKSRYEIEVMKAVGISGRADLAAIEEYEDVADKLLIDSKARSDDALPGGNGRAFSWELISQRQWKKPWMLAGGLDPSNVSDAIACTGACEVDVSSGVERSAGKKDPELMKAFVKAAKQSDHHFTPSL